MRFLALTIFSLGSISCEVEQMDVKKEDDDVNVKLLVLRDNGDRDFDKKLAALHEKWLGTAWEFSGTTKEPQKGAIACGYFVTTTLEQAGRKLERVKLAQAASETMIVQLCEKETIRRYSDVGLADFSKKLQAQREGYYLVGLDSHTGFLKVGKDNKVLFIHSGPGRGVVLEWPEEAVALAKSRYRVTGKID